MKEAKSLFIASLLLTIKNNFLKGYLCVKTSIMGKPVVGFSDSGQLDRQKGSKADRHEV